jgi:hypothetical protein
MIFSQYSRYELQKFPGEDLKQDIGFFEHCNADRGTETFFVTSA